MKEFWFYASSGIHTLYEIAGIFLGIGLFLSIKQLKLLKQDNYERRMRASAEQTVKSLENYASRIFPSQDVYYQQARRHNPDRYELNNVEPFNKYYNDSFDIDLSILTPEEVAEAIWRIDSGVETVLNHLELYSIMMTQGLSDEKIAFVPTSTHFCDFVKKNYLCICIRRARNTPYENLVNLFETWHNRIEYNEKHKEISELYDAVQDLSGKQQGIKMIGDPKKGGN